MLNRRGFVAGLLGLPFLKPFLPQKTKPLYPTATFRGQIVATNGHHAIVRRGSAGCVLAKNPTEYTLRPGSCVVALCDGEWTVISSLIAPDSPG